MLIFCFRLLYSLNSNNILSAPVDNKEQMSTEINQMQDSVVASNKSQLPNTFSVQASLVSASITNQKFETQIQSLSVIVNVSRDSPLSIKNKMMAIPFLPKVGR